MARINTNIPSLISRASLLRSSDDLQMRLQRLSTGLRLNRGADDPAGLIIAERLRSDVQGAEQGIRNSDRASSVIATAEGSLAEVSDLLNSIRALLVESASTGSASDSERLANQLQINSAIDSITRISNTSSFGGLKLLNGSMDYTLSGVSPSQISKAQVFGASFVGTSKLQVDVDVLASAQTGALFLRGDYPSQPAGVQGTILSATTIRIAGSQGVAEISLLSGTSLSSLVDGVNAQTNQTGVAARLINPLDPASGVVFESSEFGSNSFVTVERLNQPSDPSLSPWATYQLLPADQLPSFGPPFPWAALMSGGSLTGSVHDNGRDVSALINGTLATGDGLSVSVSSPGLSLKLLLNQTLATDPTSAIATFHITGGGALFQLGPQVTAQQQTNLGIQSVAASNLGGTLINGSLQFLASLKEGAGNSIKECVTRNDFSGASTILDAAVDEVAVMRGRLGAFERNVLQTNVRSLQAASENLNASVSKIRDADFAAETSALTRAQILQSAGTTVLGLANQSAQQVLQLLG